MIGATNKFNQTVATKIVQAQNPLLKFHKTMKENLRERILVQKCPIGIFLTVWLQLGFAVKQRTLQLIPTTFFGGILVPKL